ncbi:MAG: YegS/Rv2252/BmrU family lipid kinase [Cyanobacteria bacterium P01_G01_bin.49]
MIMTRSCCLIFNPVAGQGNAEEDLANIKRFLEPELDLKIQCTTKEVGVSELARKAIENKVDMIIASGGDGTVSGVAGALVGTNIPLGVIARGTANAFVNALGIPDTIEAACQVIVDGATKEIDVGMCDDQPTVLLIGIGFEAETIDDADHQTKNRWGMLAYVISGLKQLGKFKKFETKIETDEKIIKVEAEAITVANAAPATSILAHGPAGVIYDDGLLDLTIIAPKNPAGAIASSYHLLQSASNDEAAERDDIGYLRTKWVKITTDPPQKVVLDGEIIGKTPIEVRCLPKSLTVFAPVEQVTQAEEKLEHLSDIKIQEK